MAKYVLTPAKHIKSQGLIGLELDLPEIALEIPSPAEISRSAATIVAEQLRATIQAGQDINGTPLRGPAESTLRRRAYDKYPPRNPRSNRWIERYPGRVGAMLKGTLTAGAVKRSTTRWKGGAFVKRVTVFKNLSVSQLAAVDSGALWSRIKHAAAGSGSAEVSAPPERPIADIERRLGAQIFGATPKHLEAALDEVMVGVFAGWSNDGGAASAIRKALA